MYNVDCVLVTYNPDPGLLAKVLATLAPQVRVCYIINNGAPSFSAAAGNARVVNLGANYGIAYAQNRGIEMALADNADFVLLSDQDTLYPEDFVARNIAAYHDLKGENLAALFPVFFNVNKKSISPVMVKKFAAVVVPKGDSPAYIKTAHAIASGAFIAAPALKRTGLMNETLFIDYVDFEWCWRASALGYTMFTIGNLVVNHTLGDKSRKIFNRQVTIRQDIRYFYMIRNACYLICYSPYLVFGEKILFLKRAVEQIAGVMFLRPRLSTIKLLALAVHDGLSGKMGKTERTF